MKIRSPKIGGKGGREVNRWYPYYAGFSAAFVDDCLRALGAVAGSRVLDPWVGSGTTSAVAVRRGCEAAGFDLNPALILIAKGRLLDREVLPSVVPIARDLIKKAGRLSRRGAEGEPLEQWFVEGSAAELRALESSIRELLLDGDERGPIFGRTSLADVSTLAAFFYVALFLTTRSLLKRFATTNPAWIRRPATGRHRVRPRRKEVTSLFRSQVDALAEHLSKRAPTYTEPSDCDALDLGDSEQLPLEADSVDLIVGSPPYCTRIDYAVATWPELAVLGCSDRSALKALRDSMMGTPTMRTETPMSDPSWGSTCLSFLAEVETHESRASATYYSKYFNQYFSSLKKSLDELARVNRSGGACALVLQDSHYKEIHCDLQAIASEMCSELGWKPLARHDFAIAQTKAGINPASRKYRGDFSATETALLFET